MSMFNVFCPLLCGNQVKNIEEHLKTCKNKNHLNKYYFQCPFNPNHICSKNVFPIHKENCPDKRKENISLENLKENNTPEKKNKNMKNFESASFLKKEKKKNENSISNFLTEKEIKDLNTKKINEESRKIIENLTPTKGDLLFNYNDDLSTNKKKNLLKPTPIKLKKNFESKEEIQLKDNSLDLKKREKIKSNDFIDNNNKLVLIGKLKKKLNFDNEINDEKEESIYSEKTDISSDGSFKNMIKNSQKKVYFGKKIKVFVYKRNDENKLNNNKDDNENKEIKKKNNKKIKSDIKVNNSEVFAEIYTKFL